MNNVPDDNSSREERLNQILADYLQALEAGQAPEEASFLQRHAEFAVELREFLADKRRVDELARPEVPAAPSQAADQVQVPTDAPTHGGLDSATLAPGQNQVGPPPGTKVGYFGDYELLDEIARGGMGVVFKARQSTLNRIVALKMILAGHLASEDDVLRFYTEAEAAATLDHPGIVPIYEVGQYEGQHYFSMGFIEGQSLAAKVADGPLRPEVAAEFTKKVAEAIAYAHSKGVIHRDLKPANVLLDKDGQPKVTDFGLAKQAEANEGLTTTGQILGTPGYMPPEQAAGKTEEIGPAADTYSLGAILYCLLTGRPPFQSATVMDTLLQVLEQDPVSPRLLNSEVPRDLETICLKCLRKQPAHRYESAQTLADDIGRWLNHEPILARPVNRLEKTWLWCRRKPAIAALWASLVVVTLAAAGIVYERQNATHATGLVEALVTADPEQVPGVINDLNHYRYWSNPLLRQRLPAANEDSVEQLHLRLALVGRDERQVEPLYEALLRADAPHFPVITEALADYQSRITDRLWTVLVGRETDPQQRRLRAAGALAKYDPGNAKWSEVAPEVARQLVEVSPVFVGQWREVLRPVANRLIDPLAKIFMDQEQDELPRALATSLLADYAKDDPALLTKLVLDADARAFATLFPALEAHRATAIETLREFLARTVEPAWDRAALDPGSPEPPAAARGAIEGAHGMLTDRFAFCQDLTGEEFLRIAEALRPSGYRPTRVRPYGGGEAGTRVAAVWTRDGKPWELQTDLTKDQLPSPDAPAAKDGLVPADVAVWPSEDLAANRRFVLLWSAPRDANEKRWLFVDTSAQQLAFARATHAKQDASSQDTISVWTDAAGQRHYAGIWTNQGTASEIEGSYGGYELVELPQWDVAVAPAAKPADPLDALRQQLAQIADLPPIQRDQPSVRFARARSLYYLGQLEPARADLDYLVENNFVVPQMPRFRAWTLARLGEKEKARAELVKNSEQQTDPVLRGHVQIIATAWLGEHEDAAQQLESLAATAGTNSETLYTAARAANQASLACVESDPPSARQFVNRALELLEEAVANGFQNAQRFRADVEFASLQSDPRLARIMQKIEAPPRYAAVWRTDLQFESQLLTGMNPEEMRERCRQLVVQGYRPFGIAIDTGESRNAAPVAAISNGKENETANVNRNANGNADEIANGNASVLSSIIWHRPVISAAEKERLALQQSIAAVALLRLSDSEKPSAAAPRAAAEVASPASVVWPLFEHQPDPRLRSYLLHRLASYGVDPALLLARLDVEQEVSRRRVLMLAIGDFARAKLLSPEQQSAATAAFVRWYADDPDPGIHGAAEWSLRQLGGEIQIARVREKFATGIVEGDRQWYITREGQQTLAVLRPAAEFLMGSPITEAERFHGPEGKTERRHRRRIGRTFAIAMHEVTVKQFQKFQAGHDFDRTKAREEDAPANNLSWYEAAKFCNWLSEQEGLPRDQWCYDPDQNFAAGMSLYPDYLTRTGYRLLTQAEWEYACRSGATTMRFFGDTEQLLPHYAWFTKNSHDRWMLPVGSLMPNDAGLFDMHGNAAEWCQDLGLWYLKDRAWMDDKEQPASKLDNTQSRIVRGGSFMTHAPFLRSADSTPYLPNARPHDRGLRVARTLPSAL